MMSASAGSTGDPSEDQIERWLLGLELFGIELGLERIELLLARLDQPQRLPRTVHVVGSNGKSSVTRFVAAIAQQHRISVGAYLSPHVVRFRERVLIGAEPCSAAQFAAGGARVQGAVAALQAQRPELGPVTQFEALTAISFVVLSEAGVELAVIEAGLGGRLDATNVIAAPVVVLSSVSLEHTQYLGDSIEAITAEKLAVVTDRATLVVGSDLDPAALDLAVTICAERQARLVVAGREAPAALAAGGQFQRQNFALAAAAAHALLGSLDAAAVAAAAAQTVVPGRYQTVDQAPRTIFDGAHNLAAIAALASSLKAERLGGPLVGCLSVLDDKDAAAMVDEIAACSDALIFTRASHPRALDPQLLAELCRQQSQTPCSVVDEPRAALNAARQAAGPDGIAFAAGSLYLIADLQRAAGSGRGSTL